MLAIRDEAGIPQALGHLKGLRDAYRRVTVDDQGRIQNTVLMEALELERMLDAAEVMAHGALARLESRGAHFRNDFEARDDVQLADAYDGRPESGWHQCGLQTGDHCQF